MGFSRRSGGPRLRTTHPRIDEILRWDCDKGACTSDVCSERGRGFGKTLSKGREFASMTRGGRGQRVKITEHLADVVCYMPPRHRLGSSRMV